MGIALKQLGNLWCLRSPRQPILVDSLSIVGGTRGITLLEVVLSLAILGVSTGVLLQIASNATNLSQRSQRATQAQIFADSKMSEIIAGVTPAQPTSFVQTGTDFDGVQWFASINIVPTETDSMIGIAVTVTDDPTGNTGEGTQFTLTRSIIDPALGLDVPQQEESTTEEDSSSNSGQPNSSSAAGGGLGAGVSGGNTYNTGGRL